MRTHRCVFGPGTEPVSEEDEQGTQRGWQVPPLWSLPGPGTRGAGSGAWRAPLDEDRRPERGSDLRGSDCRAQSRTQVAHTWLRKWDGGGLIQC